MMGGREGELGTLIFFGEFLGFTPKNTYVYLLLNGDSSTYYYFFETKLK